MSFSMDGPDLAIVADRWRQAPPPFVVRDTTDHAQRVSVALALRRSRASVLVIQQAEKAERLARPAPRRRHMAVVSRHLMRVYGARLLESDVRDIRARWATRHAWATVRHRKPTPLKTFAREMQRYLAETHLQVSVSAIEKALNGDTWHGLGAE